MHKSKFLVENHTSTALLADIFVSILRLHVFSTENALLELKIDTVSAERLGIQLTLNLLNELVDCISKDEVALKGRVSMQVQIHKHPLLLPVVLTQFLHCKARRLPLRVRIRVVSVKVLIQGVHPTMTPRYSVRVEHGDEYKDEVFSEEVSPHVVFAEQKLDDSLHSVAGGCFDGMNSG